VQDAVTTEGVEAVDQIVEGREDPALTNGRGMT
jgi:hypothetical protein